MLLQYLESLMLLQYLEGLMLLYYIEGQMLPGNRDHSGENARKYRQAKSMSSYSPILL